jgi:hypothetical protein
MAGPEQTAKPEKFAAEAKSLVFPKSETLQTDNALYESVTKTRDAIQDLVKKGDVYSQPSPLTNPKVTNAIRELATLSDILVLDVLSAKPAAANKENLQYLAAEVKELGDIAAVVKEMTNKVLGQRPLSKNDEAALNAAMLASNALAARKDVIGIIDHRVRSLEGNVSFHDLLPKPADIGELAKEHKFDQNPLFLKIKDTLLNLASEALSGIERRQNGYTVQEVAALYTFVVLMERATR